jgi:hypothetical protein
MTVYVAFFTFEDIGARMSENAAEINVRSPRYWIASAPTVCEACGEGVTVSALAVMAGHETLELGEEAADDAWSLATGSAFLFFVEYLPEHVRLQLSVMAPAYRPHVGRAGEAGSDFGEVSHWVNHCERCGSTFDEQALFGELGGAFVPATVEQASRVRLLRIEETFEAAVGGYAYEPEFFDSMSTG